MQIYDRKSKNIPIAIRDGVPEDVSFIFSSWLKSYRGGGGMLQRHVDNTIYFTEQHKLVERLLKRCVVKIATDPADPATIYGYIVYEHLDGILTMHYGYVKQTFRAMGVLRQLLKSFDHDWNGAGLYTHSTIIAARLSLKYNLVYHPYILVNYNDVKAPEKTEAPNE